MRVLVVCSGNICRSPMAEGILVHLLERQGLVASVRSSGTLGIVGRAPAPNAIAACRERGVEIAHLRSSALDAVDLAWADLVLCMEEHHKEACEAETAPSRPRLLLLGAYEPALPDGEIPDPVGQGIDAFRATRDLLWRCLERFLDDYALRGALGRSA